MHYHNVCIEAVGYVLPPNVVTSQELEDAFAGTLARLGLPPGQIEKLSGVRERRLWDPGVQPSTVAAMAGERALENAGLTPGDIGVVINTSVSRDFLEPATAAMVMGKLGVPHATMGFDVSHACVGFLQGMQVAANMVELGQVRRALVVCGETTRDGIEATVRRLAEPTADAAVFRDNFATLTLGSGAVAMVLSHRDVSQVGHKLNGAVSRTATEHNTLCLANHHEMLSDPHGLLVHGTGLGVETWPHAVDAFGWGPDSVDEFVCHQVSLAHFTTVFERLELPLHKALLTFPYLGNCGPASLPLTLALGLAQGRIRDGQELCLYGVGSGLACTIMGVSW